MAEAEGLADSCRAARGRIEEMPGVLVATEARDELV
jgi:hypothetical protein